MVQCAPGKVIAVPCAEKGRSPDEQMLISGRKDPVFSFRFAASVNRGGIDAISFAIRAFASIKHQIGREGHERDARCGALMRQDRCTCRVRGQTGVHFLFRTRHANETRCIDDCPGFMVVAGRTDGALYADVRFWWGCWAREKGSE